MNSNEVPAQAVNHEVMRPNERQQGVPRSSELADVAFQRLMRSVRREVPETFQQVEEMAARIARRHDARNLFLQERALDLQK